MKKFIFAIALSFCTVPVFAQKGLFLRPVAGIGLTNATTDFYETGNSGNDTKKSAYLSYRFQAGIGYAFGKWSIESGIGYFRTGYDKAALLSSPANPTGEGSAIRIRAIYGHIGVPVLAGYRLGLTKRISVEPALGAEATYNLGRTTDLSGGINERSTDRQSDFTEDHQRISLFGTGRLYLTYQLQRKVALTGGLSGKYMLTNLLKAPYNPQYDASQRNYLMTFDLGIKYKI